jgi:hypothetical protein
MKLWILMAALAAMPAHAENARPSDAEYDRFAERVVEAAASSRDARVLMAAAAFGEGLPAMASKVDALYARALVLGVDDPVVWWIAASECPASDALCDGPAAARRLRELAPNNAASWLFDAGEGDDLDARVAKAAGAVRFDAYDGELVRAFHAAATLAPAPASFVDEAAKTGPGTAMQRVHVALALGKWMAQALPPFGDMVGRCRANDVRTELGRHCDELDHLLLDHSNNVLARRIGSARLLARLAPGRERNDIEMQRRRLDWLQAAALDAAGNEAYPAALLHWLQPNANEFTVMLATLEDEGIPPEPPPHWRSDRQPVLPGG